MNGTQGLRIRELNEKETAYVKRISLLHKKAFPDFFLTRLGVPFLKTLYSSYLEDERSGIIVAETDNGVVGFAAYSREYDLFYKNLIRKHLPRFAFCSLGAALRHPSFIGRLFGAFKKSESVTKEERYVELSSICVDPEAEGHGIGSALIDVLKNKVDFSTFAFINLETDAKDNEEVNRFYIKNGFELARKYTTSEGREMNEYRYAPKETGSAGK